MPHETGNAMAPDLVSLRLSRQYPTAWVTPDANGLAWMDGAVRVAFAPKDFQLFWVHQLEPTDPTATTLDGRMMPALVARADEISAAIAQGRGMLLTGLAPLYALVLRRADGTAFEQTVPDVQEADRFVVGRIGPRLAVGLAPVDPAHPIFAGLPSFDHHRADGKNTWAPGSGGIWFGRNYYDPSDPEAVPAGQNLVPECMWTRANEPGQGPTGTVLAHRLAREGETITVQQERAAMVEYAHGLGRVVSCGDLACDLTPDWVAPTDEEGARRYSFEEMRRRVRVLMRSVLQYLAHPS